MDAGPFANVYWRTFVLLVLIPVATPFAVSTGQHLDSVTPTLQELQQEAASVVESYEQGEDFNPWLRNRHVQTIGGFFLGDLCPYVPADGWLATQRLVGSIIKRLSSNPSEERAATFWDSRERIETPDGDWFYADTKYGSEPDCPKVLLLHGLEANSHSRNSMELAQAFYNVGMTCVCLNFRGCTGEPNENFSGYHLGFTDDLHHYLKLMAEREETNKPVYLSGFSMGANVVLKCLGELGARAADYNIQGASVMGPPLDQNRNAVVLAQPGVNRLIYTQNLLQKLKDRTKERVDSKLNGNYDTDFFDFHGCMKAETITEFDDAFHRGVNGFADCWDYYTQTSSIFYLDNIATPTLLLGAEDDPFFDSSVWPIEKSSQYGGKAPLKMLRTPHGGHLGYSFHIVKDENDPKLSHQGGSSWAPREVANFLAHVETVRATQ